MQIWLDDFCSENDFMRKIEGIFRIDILYFSFARGLKYVVPVLLAIQWSYDVVRAELVSWLSNPISW